MGGSIGHYLCVLALIIDTEIAFQIDTIFCPPLLEIAVFARARRCLRVGTKPYCKQL